MNITGMVAEIEARVESMPIRNTPALRTLRREYSKRIAASPAEEVIELAAALIQGRRVHRFVADEFVATRTDVLRILDLTRIERLGSCISSWDQVDSFACYLSGPAWRNGQISDEAVLKWARSPDRWWRRAALVSTVPLNSKARGGHGDIERTLRICSLLMDDRDEMIVKALSWALRALAKRQRDAVRQFIGKNESRLPALARREVWRQLMTGRKTPIAPQNRRSPGVRFP